MLPDGTAIAPDDAPEPVKRVIQAGNAISKLPYKWGGGHGAWRDSGYDCSGSVSFALAGAGLLRTPLTSGGFMNWGGSGPGEWITIYANGGHVFMVVAGLRFDTSGQGRAGTRWQQSSRQHQRFCSAPRARAVAARSPFAGTFAHDVRAGDAPAGARSGTPAGRRVTARRAAGRPGASRRGATTDPSTCAGGSWPRSWRWSS